MGPIMKETHYTLTVWDCHIYLYAYIDPDFNHPNVGQSVPWSVLTNKQVDGMATASCGLLWV